MSRIKGTKRTMSNPSPPGGGEQHSSIDPRERMMMTEAQQAELAALAALPDDKINTAAFPEQTDWSHARRGVFKSS